MLLTSGSVPNIIRYAMAGRCVTSQVYESGSIIPPSMTVQQLAAFEITSNPSGRAAELYRDLHIDNHENVPPHLEK